MTSTDLDFCRLCFRQDGNISVFNYECDDAWSLTDRIFECVSVQISQNDKLPHMICRLCLDHVIKWCEFKTYCDRNQRSWFLWLKSLAQGTPQEICEGLAENARRKSLELGFTRNLNSPRKSAFHNYKSISAAAPKGCRNAVVISGEEIEESHNSNSKELRIESTLSLVTDKETILSPFQATQKLTNGYVILDTHNLSERFGKSIENEQPSNNSKTQSESCIIIESPERTNHSSDEEQHLNSYNNQNKDTTVDPEQNYNSGDNLSKTHTDNLALSSNYDQDCEDNFEVESAFSEDMVTDEPISEREVALLNGEEPVEEENNLDHVESNAPILQTSEKEASSEFSMPSLPKRFVSACPREILKERLMQGVDKRSSPNVLASQPKRPDTPYPHEILKNMGHVLESGSTYKVSPQPTSSPLVNTLDDGRHFNFSTPLSGASEVTPASPPRSLKPVSLSHLMKPQPVSSDRNSESSDSLSFPQVNVQWRVKQEPVSETEDSDDNEGQFSNISIKFEPLDYVEHSQEQPMSSPEIPPSNTTYCDTCSKHFSSHTQLVRHIHSKIHKRVASFVALGNRVDSQTVSQLTKEIRSQAYFRSCAKKQMIAMANEKNISGLQSDTSVAASSPLVEIPTSSNTSLRQADNELLECKVCNVVLKSRSYKIKHDNSFSHKCQMEAVANSLEPPNTIDPPNAVPGTSLLHAPTYTCPFASCSSAFADGGQLIVHMHTHGISLPIHEVNKQIELSQTSIQKKLPAKQMNSDSAINKFTCRRCGRFFPKALSLSNHLRRCRIVPAKVTVGLSIPCPVCLAMQKNSRTLTYHMKTYHPQSEQNVVESNPPPPKREFVCTICYKSFTTRIHLRGHNYKVHAQKPVCCKFCKKVYNSKDNLHVHYRTAHLKVKEGEYACYVCFKVFQSYSECCKHRKAGCSLKMKLFSCTECGHSFRSQFSLDKHKEEHTSTAEVEIKEPPPPPLDLSFLEDIQNCVCNICSRSYSSYYNLRRHVKTSHVSETNGCSLDDLIKASASGLNISLASGIKEESLQEASTSVVNDTPAIRRVRNINCERNFGCLYCESKFSTNSNRLSHMKAVCKCVPPKVVCLNCKVERWPWVTGLCKNCGKDINTKKRSATTRAENLSKRFRSSGPEQIDSFPQELVDSQFSAPELVNESAKPAKISNNRVFRCSVGKRTFLSQKSMLNHSTTCDGSCKDQGVYCKVCHQVFANPKVYIRHKPCGGKKLIQKPMLGKKILRINMNDPLRVIPCNFCDYKFKTKKNVSNHMRTIHNYYASAYRKKRSLDQTAVPTEEDSLINISGREEIPLQEFNEGEPVSSTSHDVADNAPPNPNRRACPACSKPFSNHQAVVQHVRTHHKNKFSVLECAFCSKSILKRQLYEHGFTCIKDQLANINTLECVVCSTIFYSGDEEDTLSLKLQEHIMNCCGKLNLAKGEKFKNKEKFLCLKCCMLFSSKKSLYAHSFERHGILVQTSPTSQQKNNPINIDKEVLDVTQSDSVMQETDNVLELASATSDSNLTVSTTEDTHPFKCHRCCKRFKTAKGLLSHKSSAHMYQSRKKKKPSLHLKCKFCQRQFYSEVKLRNHEKVHGIVKEVVRTEVEEIHEVPASPDVEIVSET